MKHLEHKHIIIQADVLSPPGKNDLNKMNDWFRDLIESINMKILSGPHMVYCDMVGNRGFTGVCAIETSHICIHLWDENNPGKMELDVYTCSSLDPAIVLDKIRAFNPVRYEYTLIDREHGQRVLENKVIRL